MRRNALREFREWRQAAATQKRLHEFKAKAWTAFGLFGVYDYVHRNGLTFPAEGIAASIPVLFFISVMAMQQGEKNQAGNAKLEQKQEDAEEEAHVGREAKQGNTEGPADQGQQAEATTQAEGEMTTGGG